MLPLLGMILALGASPAAGAPSSTPQYEVTGHLNLGGAGHWDYLVIDPASARLFVTRGDRVDVVEAGSGKHLGTVPQTSGVHGVALAPALGRGFTSNGRANTVTAFDLKTLARLRDVPVGGENPDAIVFDPATQTVLTMNGRSHDATVIDARTLAVRGKIPLGDKPEFAVADGTGHVFANLEGTGRLVRIDVKALRADAPWKLDDCEEPTGLALDTAHGRLFSVCQNGRMVVTDVASGRQVAAVPIGQGPDGAAFDATRGLAFSSNGRDGTLTVVRERDANHFEVVQTVSTQKSARTVTLDPTSGRLYLSAARFEPAAQAHGRPPMVEGSFGVVVVSPK